MKHHGRARLDRSGVRCRRANPCVQRDLSRAVRAFRDLAITRSIVLLSPRRATERLDWQRPRQAGPAASNA